MELKICNMFRYKILPDFLKTKNHILLPIFEINAILTKNDKIIIFVGSNHNYNPIDYKAVYKFSFSVIDLLESMGHYNCVKSAGSTLQQFYNMFFSSEKFQSTV